MMNIINGGSHSDAPIAFQEFMVRPIALNLSAKVLHGHRSIPRLKKYCKTKVLAPLPGDEGGFAQP